MAKKQKSVIEHRIHIEFNPKPCSTCGHIRTTEEMGMAIVDAIKAYEARNGNGWAR